MPGSTCLVQNPDRIFTDVKYYAPAKTLEIQFSHLKNN